MARLHLDNLMKIKVGFKRGNLKAIQGKLHNGVLLKIDNNTIETLKKLSYHKFT